MKFTLKGGVLIIGSLYWQDHLKDKDDNIRNNWRKTRLDKNNSVDVLAPIRYGRFSKDQSYTMIFDSILKTKDYGDGKFCPFQRSTRSWEDLNEEVRLLAVAEGMGGDFIAGKSAWSVCGILFNLKVEFELREFILKKWQDRFLRYDQGYSVLLSDLSLYAMDANGQFSFPWPRTLKDYDYLIAAATQPKLRKEVSKLTVQEIANYVHNREYFHPNRANGIITYQDEDILRILINKDESQRTTNQ